MNLRSNQLVIVVSLSLIISACGSAGSAYRNYGYDVYQLKLLHPLTVPAGSSHVYITAPGRVVSRQEIGTYELYCKFSIPRPKSSDQFVIKADEFRIKNIYARTPIALHSPVYRQSASYGQYSGFFNHHDLSKQDLELKFEIESQTQTNVKSMSCVRFSDPSPSNVPTLSQAREVFRGLAEFNY